jgi:hypothetical protein
LITRRMFPVAVAAVGVATHQCATANAYPAMIGTAGLRPNAANLAQYIANTYPGVQSIGGVRPDPLPDHPSGRAIDVMIGTNMGLGDTIAADIRSQTGRFNVSYILWRVPNHFNHVHISVRG